MTTWIISWQTSEKENHLFTTTPWWLPRNAEVARRGVWGDVLDFPSPALLFPRGPQYKASIDSALDNNSCCRPFMYHSSWITDIVNKVLGQYTLQYKNI